MPKCLPKIGFTYRLDQSNIGDVSSCPLDYFDWAGAVLRLDLCGDLDPLKDCDLVILGGGGLFYPAFKDALAAVLALGVPVVGWGVGTNVHGKTCPDYLGLDLGRFALLGLRDAGAGDRGAGWVPCVSCLSPAFDQPEAPTRPVVAYEHKDHPLGLDLPSLRNDVHSMSKAVRFLASAETVVTNTYHGWYWATLLGRRVVLYRPFSSRFYALPWPCPVASEPEEVLTRIGEAQTYPEALSEARRANLGFRETVLSIT